MIIFIDRLECLYTINRESLLKGKDRYDWPPCTTSFRLAAFKFKKYIFFFFYKTSHLNKEVNCTKPSPSVRVPCTKKWLSETFLSVSRIGGRTWYFLLFLTLPLTHDLLAGWQEQSRKSKVRIRKGLSLHICNRWYCLVSVQCIIWKSNLQLLMNENKSFWNISYVDKNRL